MSRKIISSIPSSFASIYLISAFFAISFFSLLYLKYPQQINHLDYFRSFPPPKTPTIPLSTQDLTTPSVNVLVQEKVVNTVEVLPTPSSDSNQTIVEQHSSPVVSNSPSNSTTVVEEEEERIEEPISTPSSSSSSVEQLLSPVDYTPVKDAVNSSETPTTTTTVGDSENSIRTPSSSPNEQLSPPVDNTPVKDAVNSSETPIDQLSQSVVSSSETPTTEVIKEVETEKNPAAISEENQDQIIQSMTVDQPPPAVKIEEKQEEEEDETIDIATYDHIAHPPINYTREERIEWLKQRLPESKILESTARTRKFERKMQEFILKEKCRVNIFMTWISSTKYFGKREFFSLESVLKSHPKGCVIIISRIMASKAGKQLLKPLLERGHSILTVAPDFPLVFDGTPAQDWLDRLKNGLLDPGKIPITQNLSNLLRLVVLYKYGGVYLDTDMIILKDVSVLRNSIGIQEIDQQRKTWNSVNNAVLIFDKHHPLLFRFMEEFNSSFDGSLWGHNGPYMATRIIKKIVNDPNYQFNVMSPMAFYPVDWVNVHKFFQKGDNDWGNDMYYKVSKESYGVHLWNKISRDLKIEQTSVIGRIISDHCIICQDVYGL